MIALTKAQHTVLSRYADGQARRLASGRPNANLIRRNLLTLDRSAGLGFYRITPLGLAALGERRAAPVADDLSSELQACVGRVTQEGRFDLLEELLVGVDEILRHPAAAEPSRRDPDV